MNTLKIAILNETATGLAVALKSELLNNPHFAPPSTAFRVVDGIWSVLLSGSWLDLLSVANH